MNTTWDGRHRTKVWLDDVRPSGEWKIIGSDVETHRHRPLNGRGEWMGWTMGRRVDQTNHLFIFTVDHSHHRLFCRHERGAAKVH